ncbi:MAG TPA: endonuclease/exonuclease/phosphatase family protein [Pirellulaceae bacterium]|nr:endonuclease/exonuclease/phosphatase family protein [Pirellulaceae bacterium]
MAYWYRCCLIGLIAATLADADKARGDDPESIRIASWNVEWFFDHYAGDNRSDLAKEKTAPSRASWQWKLSTTAKIIAELEPTIIALQEIENQQVLFNLVRELEEQHGLKYRYAYIPGYDFFTEQDVAFLYQHGLVEYSRREQSPEMFESREYYNLNKHLFARFEFGTGDNKESVTLVNVHLRSGAEQEDIRKRQMRLLKAWIDPLLVRGENVILLGDLNTEQFVGQYGADSDMGIATGMHTPQTEDDMIDLHQFLPEPLRNTHITEKQLDRLIVSPALTKDIPGRRDLVFSRIITRRDLVIGDDMDPVEDHFNRYWELPDATRDVSDHYPIMAEFIFK